jgi:hypothetical protein
MRETHAKHVPLLVPGMPASLLSVLVFETG